MVIYLIKNFKKKSTLLNLYVIKKDIYIGLIYAWYVKLKELYNSQMQRNKSNFFFKMERNISSSLWYTLNTSWLVDAERQRAIHLSAGSK